jgi:hypothetical protein
MPCLSCPGSLLGTCLVQPVFIVLSQLSCLRCPVQTRPPCAHPPRPGNLVHSPPGTSVMFLAVQSSLSFPCQANLFILSCPDCLVLAALSELSCPISLPRLSCFSCPSLLSYSGRSASVSSPVCTILSVNSGFKAQLS